MRLRCYSIDTALSEKTEQRETRVYLQSAEKVADDHYGRTWHLELQLGDAECPYELGAWYECTLAPTEP